MYTSNEYEIKEEEVTNLVCLCKPGFYGQKCETQLYHRCMVNITSPPVYDISKCEVPQIDSMEYMFSIEGFAPCWYFDLSKTYDIKYRLNCKAVGADGEIQIDEHIGYKYQDVKKVEKAD